MNMLLNPQANSGFIGPLGSLARIPPRADAKKVFYNIWLRTKHGFGLSPRDKAIVDANERTVMLVHAMQRIDAKTAVVFTDIQKKIDAEKHLSPDRTQVVAPGLVRIIVKRNASGWSVAEVERESAKIGKKLVQEEITKGNSRKYALCYFVDFGKDTPLL